MMRLQVRRRFLFCVLVAGGACACSSEEGAAFRGVATEVPEGHDAGVAADARVAQDTSTSVEEAAAPVCDPRSVWAAAPLQGVPSGVTHLSVSADGLSALWVNAAGALGIAERADRAAAFSAPTSFFVQPLPGQSATLSPGGLTALMLEPPNKWTSYTRGARGQSFDLAKSGATLRQQGQVALPVGATLRSLVADGDQPSIFIASALLADGATALGRIADQAEIGDPVRFEFSAFPVAASSLTTGDRVVSSVRSAGLFITTSGSASRIWSNAGPTLPLATFPYADLSLSADGCSYGYGMSPAGPVALSR